MMKMYADVVCCNLVIINRRVFIKQCKRMVLNGRESRDFGGLVK